MTSIATDRPDEDPVDTTETTDAVRTRMLASIAESTKRQHDDLKMVMNMLDGISEQMSQVVRALGRLVELAEQAAPLMSSTVGKAAAAVGGFLGRRSA